ncbi:MAG: acetyl/propionyl/methylcrotonyl-CoA carboxylase subunit alpha [Nostocoides sp.]
MFESVLIANRGEIAARIARACRDLGLRSIAVYSDADRDARHVRLADHAVHIGPAPVHESYLNGAAIISAAVEAGAGAIHPGYGLLSENADFAAQVRAAGLVFVGPNPEVIDVLGDKRTARTRAAAAGLAVLPACGADVGTAAADAAELGYPLLVKAAFGGGGRGMRVVTAPEELKVALGQAHRENQAAFGRAEIYLERFLPKARHIEVQILGDHGGHIRHLGTRDCTTQRRNQKLIEEAPAAGLPTEQIDRAVNGSVRLAQDVGYQGAGTVEFLADPDTGELYFLEVNTRLQVEHTTTELVTGIDIVVAQLQIALGQDIPFTQEDVRINGHAIEARVNAEDASSGFVPGTGTIGRCDLPEGPWVRVDSGVASGMDVSAYYDSLLAKITVWGPHRNDALARMGRALDETVIEGLPTTVGFLRRMLEESNFLQSTHWTSQIDSGEVDMTGWESPGPQQQQNPDQPWRSARISTPDGLILVDVPISSRHSPGGLRERLDPDQSDADAQTADALGGVAPMDGVLVRHTVQVGDIVEAKTTVAVVESMKMETHVVSGQDGVVAALHAVPGTSLRRGDRLVSIEEHTP